MITGQIHDPRPAEQVLQIPVHLLVREALAHAAVPSFTPEQA